MATNSGCHHGAQTETLKALAANPIADAERQKYRNLGIVS
jgi:hypothetical protein